MAHLNCFLPRATGVNFCFFIAVPPGGGCWYKAKWKMWDAATQNRRRNDRAKLWIFRKIAKCRWWRFSKRWHVADVKNITGNNQATLMVDRHSANIAYSFWFYVCLRLQDRDCCSVADGNGSYYGLGPSFFEEMTCCRHHKLHWRWPGNHNGRLKFCNLHLFTFTRSKVTLCGWWKLPEID